MAKCDDTNFIISSSVNEHVIKVGKRIPQSSFIDIIFLLLN